MLGDDGEGLLLLLASAAPSFGVVVALGLREEAEGVKKCSTHDHRSDS